jgi:hypothetical protein
MTRNGASTVADAGRVLSPIGPLFLRASAVGRQHRASLYRGAAGTARAVARLGREALSGSFADSRSPPQGIVRCRSVDRRNRIGGPGAAIGCEFRDSPERLGARCCRYGKFVGASESKEAYNSKATRFTPIRSCRALLGVTGGSDPVQLSMQSRPGEVSTSAHKRGLAMITAMRRLANEKPRNSGSRDVAALSDQPAGKPID